MNACSIQLRQWKDADLTLFAAMNADSDVMRYFVRPLSFEESSLMLFRFREAIEARGWGLWAVEVDGEFAGFAGLSQPSFTSHFTPCTEIGWRFRQEFWGRSIAFAAAQAAENFAFSKLGLNQLVSFTTESNLRSRRLMERLGFARNPAEDFLHPLVAVDHPLRPHVLCKKSKSNQSSEPTTPVAIGAERRLAPAAVGAQR